MGRSIAVVTALFSLLFVGSLGCFSVSLLGGGRGPLSETVVFGERGPKILMIEVEGLISESQEQNLWGLGRESSIARLREQLDIARGDSKVRAVLLRINTPGGTASASEEMYSELLRFKRESGVPVVAQLMGTATSGGYYVAMAADEIYANPTTVTGSIGVIFMGVNVVGLMDKLGIEDETVTGGEYKDAGSPLRRMTPAEREQFQSIVDDLHDRFMTVVASGRPGLSEQDVSQVSSGRIFSAPQALDRGLIDGMGSIEEAVEKTRRLAGLEEARVVVYHRRREWRNNLYTEAPNHRDLEFSLLSSLLPRPGFHYLWWPGSP